MLLKRINQIFGFSFFIFGVLKLLLIVIAFIVLKNTAINVLYGVEKEMFGSLILATLISLLPMAEILLCVGGLGMIIANRVDQPEVIVGYLFPLGAILLELIMPTSLMVFFIFVDCGLYMKGGTKIIKENNYSVRKDKLVKNTEWFYKDNPEEEEEKRG